MVPHILTGCHVDESPLYVTAFSLNVEVEAVAAGYRLAENCPGSCSLKRGKTLPQVRLAVSLRGS